MSGDFIERLWAKLREVDVVQPSGIHVDHVISSKLKDAMHQGRIQVEVFSQLVTPECSF